MENNVCGVNQLDSDVLLPPRKRLLACLKKQNSDVNVNVNGNGNSNPDSPSSCNPLNQLDNRISELLKAHLSNDNPSEEEIAVASKAAAEVAVKVATAARAVAQEKAVAAARAMAAAKKALELVANFEDGHERSSFAEQERKMNKIQKQVDVHMLYNNKKPSFENGKTNDEDVARKLHQAINSSPRISKCGVPSDVKSHHKHKKLKTSENGGISNGSIVIEGICSSTYAKEVENMKNGSNESNMKRVDGDNNTTTSGRKRGRMKQKKLPLSICHDRDQATLKADVSPKSALSVGASASERGPLWKCKAFKVPACVNQNKVMQS